MLRRCNKLAVVRRTKYINICRNFHVHLLQLLHGKQLHQVMPWQQMFWFFNLHLNLLHWSRCQYLYIQDFLSMAILVILCLVFPFHHCAFSGVDTKRRILQNSESYNRAKNEIFSRFYLIRKKMVQMSATENPRKVYMKIRQKIP